MYKTYAAGIIIPTGSLNDPVGKEGLHHLMEHMLFENNYSLKLKKELEKVGGVYNAVTSHNFIAIYGQTLMENKPELDGFLEILVEDFKVTEMDLIKEKQIISKEIMMYDNQPIEKLNDFLMLNSCGKTFNILGTTSTVNNIEIRDLFSLFNQIRKSYKFVNSISDSEEMLTTNLLYIEDEPEIEKQDVTILKFDIPKNISYIGISMSIPLVLTKYSDTVMDILYNQIFKNLREENGLIYRALKRKTYTHNNVVYNFFFQCKPKEVTIILKCIEEIFSLFKTNYLNEDVILNHVKSDKVKEKLLTDTPIGDIKKKMYDSLEQKFNSSINDLLKYLREADYVRAVLISDKCEEIDIKKYR